MITLDDWENVAKVNDTMTKTMNAGASLSEPACNAVERKQISNENCSHLFLGETFSFFEQFLTFWSKMS